MPLDSCTPEPHAAGIAHILPDLQPGEPSGTAWGIAPVPLTAAGTSDTSEPAHKCTCAARGPVPAPMAAFREDEGPLCGEPGRVAEQRALCATLMASGWVGAACVMVSDAPLPVTPSGEPLLES